VCFTNKSTNGLFLTATSPSLLQGLQTVNNITLLSPQGWACAGSNGTNWVLRGSTVDPAGQLVPITIAGTTFTPNLLYSGHTIQLIHASCNPTACTIGNPSNIAQRVGYDGKLIITQSATSTSGAPDTVVWGSQYKFVGGAVPTLSAG